MCNVGKEVSSPRCDCPLCKMTFYFFLVFDLHSYAINMDFYGGFFSDCLNALVGFQRRVMRITGGRVWNFSLVLS